MFEGGALRFLDILRIDQDQFLPAGIVGKRDAHDVIGRERGIGQIVIAAGKREDFELRVASVLQTEVV